MSLFQAILLGLVQGLTEFLPVSSSGHLALTQRLLPGFEQPGLVFDVVLHLGTVVAVLALEWRRLLESFREGTLLRLAMQLALATVATAAVAFPLRNLAESAFTRPLLVAFGLAVTGVLLLLLARCRRQGVPIDEVPWRAVALVGLVQGLAVWPGLSRSGSTITAAVCAGFDRRWAVDFSFLASVPAILGVAFVEVLQHRQALAASELTLPYLAGGLTAAVAGGLSLLAVRRLVLQGRLYLFAFYVLPLAAIVAALSLGGVL